MQRILIIGNSGSGKSWLGRALAERFQVPHIELDKIFWAPGSYQEKRTQAEVDRAMEAVRAQQRWVVEGVFGQLIAPLTASAEGLVFLDLPWESCRCNLLERSSQRTTAEGYFETPESLASLLAWASNYHQRQTQAAFSYHNALYERFPGSKFRLQSREAIGAFLADGLA